MLRLLPVAAVGLVILLLGAFAFAPAASQSPSDTPSPTPDETWTGAPWPSLTPVPTWVPIGGEPSPSETPPPPTSGAGAPWSAPSWYTGPLHAMDWVRITGTDSCLNVRLQPALYVPTGDGTTTDSSILNCLPDGFVGQLSFGPTADWAYQPVPVQADGYVWWNILGQGWVAEEFLEFVHGGDAPLPQRAELAGTGLIVFTRPTGVWVVGADGTEPRLLYPIDQVNETVGTVSWSPDGQLIAVGLNSWTKSSNNPYTTNPYTTKIIDLDGQVVEQYDGMSEASWSPDGNSLSAMMAGPLEGMAGFQTVPMVVDRESGASVWSGTASGFSRPPEFSPDGGSIAVVCRGFEWQEALLDGTFANHTVDCGGDGLQIVTIADGSTRLLFPLPRVETDWYVSAPSWSPDGQTISVFQTGGDCVGYSLIDVWSGSTTSCLALPNLATFGFGGCGGYASETGASDWSPDGTTLAYHWQFSSGQNGVALVDVATGERQMIFTTTSSNISFSGDGEHLSYGAAGYIWTADSDTSDVTRLTDGWSPEWQPQP